jgi:hypothetical protein
MNQYQISDDAFKDAEKRHEENFEKELQEVDVRKVTLKVKNAVLEQARLNNRLYNRVSDQEATIRSLTKNISVCESKVDKIGIELIQCKKIFSDAVLLLEEKKKKKKGFFTGFWEFLKCLMN